MELWEIIDKGGIEELKKLISSGFDVNQGDDWGETLLHHAVHKGNLKMIRFLLQKGADINSTDSLGYTPLLNSVEKKQEDVIEFLLSQGADVNLGKSTNGKALHKAASNGNIRIGQLLLEHGAEVSAIDNEADCWTPLHHAAYGNHLDFVKLLVESGADIYAAGDLGWPMDEALSQGHKAVAEYLYSLVENTHPGALGTPLHVSAGLRNKELLQNFSGDNEDIDIRDYASRTPLHWAAGRDRPLYFRIILEHYEKLKEFELPSTLSRGDVQMAIEFLLDKGAEIDAKDYADNTPLLLALQWGQEDAAKELIARGANANVADKTGWTPFILAASGGRVEILETLVQKGADIQAIRNGWNALNHACHHGKEQAARFLLDCGMDVNGPQQHTKLAYPILSAVFMGHFEIVKLLLERGADIDVKDYRGDTVFSLARENKKILRLLKEYKASK